MKKSTMTCALVLFGLTSSAWAALVTGSQDWYTYLFNGYSASCVAFYGLGSVEFAQPPEWLFNEHTPPYNSNIAGWETELSADGNVAYIYGPRITSPSGSFLECFANELFFQWDNEAPGFDPNYPVYFDFAIFDGPFGSEPIYAVGWRGTPGDANSWKWKDNDPYAGPYQTEEPYTNPAPQEVPEPMTICILGLSAAFIRKRRR
jgi:hypothetical protein